MGMSTGAATKLAALPKSATITIQNQKPTPSGEVEVSADGGRIIFRNEDKCDYRLRLYKPGSKSATGIDVLLPEKGSTTVLIKPEDEFMYEVLNLEGSAASSASATRIYPLRT